MECREWSKNREETLERLREHTQKGLVDYDIKEFLYKFNSIGDCIYTTSSCSGRVVVLTGEDIFSKRYAKIVEAWHDPEECKRKITNYYNYNTSTGITWISLQPPILHIAAKDMELAEEIVSCAVTSGFIRAGYKKMKPCGYHVEIAAHDKLHVILPAPISILRSLCEILSRYKEKLQRLEDCLLSIKCNSN